MAPKLSLAWGLLAPCLILFLSWLASHWTKLLCHYLASFQAPCPSWYPRWLGWVSFASLSAGQQTASLQSTSQNASSQPDHLQPDSTISMLKVTNPSSPAAPEPGPTPLDQDTVRLTTPDPRIFGVGPPALVPVATGTVALNVEAVPAPFIHRSHHSGRLFWLSGHPPEESMDLDDVMLSSASAPQLPSTMEVPLPSTPADVSPGSESANASFLCLFLCLFPTV